MKATFISNAFSRSRRNLKEILGLFYFDIIHIFKWSYKTVCAKVPESRESVGYGEKITLYPYGCAKLRMTEMPLMK